MQRDGKELTPEELERKREEQFRKFFTTSVVNIPGVLEGSAEHKKDKKKVSPGVFQKLFNKKQPEQLRLPADAAKPAQESGQGPAGQKSPTGEVSLGGQDGTLAEGYAGLEAVGEVRLDQPGFVQAAGPCPAPPATVQDQDMDIDLALPPVQHEVAEDLPPDAEDMDIGLDLALPVQEMDEAAAPGLPLAAAPAEAMPSVQQIRMEEKQLAEQLAAMAAQNTAEAVRMGLEPPAQPAEAVQPQPPEAVAAPSPAAQPASEEAAQAQAQDASASAAAQPAPYTALRFASLREEENQSIVSAGPDAPEQAPDTPAPAAPAEQGGPAAETPPSFRMFGTAEDEAPAAQSAAAQPDEDEDGMSISLEIGSEDDEEAAGTTAAQQGEQAAPAQQAQPGEDEPAASPADAVGEAVQLLYARLMLRCALSGVLAAALLVLGFMCSGVLPPMASLDPIAAPQTFFAANLLLTVAAAAAALPLLRDGLAGLVKEPSIDSLPAITILGAVVQALTALLDANNFLRTGLSLFSGAAALLVFLHNLGALVHAGAVRDGYRLLASGVEHQGAYRLQDRNLIRTLAAGLEEADPWILLSQPVEWMQDFIQRSFSERASDRRARRLAYILFIAGALAYNVMLILGRGQAAAVSAATAVLCMGTPAALAWVVALPALRLQREAGAVGAVVPGWSAVEELGGISTLQADARDLFTPECAKLQDIRLFNGGRIDTVLLYAASVLYVGCNTLSGLFRDMIVGRTDILLPVKDLEKHWGLGFAAWCDNHQLHIGTGAYMRQQGVELPEEAAALEQSDDGGLQVLYLAVSGSLQAVLLLRYSGGRNAARSLNVLQRERIRLLVRCDDPTLTAARICALYHLPQKMVHVMDAGQCAALEPALQYKGSAACCMVHLKGFASLVGGIRAASRAQNAERTGTNLASLCLCLSVVFTLLLCFTGSISTLSLAAVLVYQLVWGALCVGIALMRA